MDDRPPVGWILELRGMDVAAASESFRQSATQLYRARRVLPAAQLIEEVDLLLLRVDRTLLHQCSGNVRRELLETVELVFRVAATGNRRRLSLLDAWIASSAARTLRQRHAIAWRVPQTDQAPAASGQTFT